MVYLTIKEYRAANDGDYDYYRLSDGTVYWLWLKAPFKGGETAIVQIITDDNKIIGEVWIEKNITTAKMSLNGKIIEVPITINQDLRPNKKYFMDKIVRNFLMS